ncbi:T-complex protein 11-domain-containing protein [Cryomyces antarcticus]
MHPNEDIPEEEDLMILSDDAGHVYPPPARIAARFYRQTNTRRKSSAASSRRNSMSSTQSHQSSRSLRAGYQSNYVAQHLRRASIIESRKARLADRAVHAEQVRLRAALAKAAPRSSNCEEKALAAQQAREKYLAQVASACAGEVKRAKKIAEDMKERKAAEERRLKQEMEEKLADAERRRFEYKRNTKRSRTVSIPAPADEKVVDEVVVPLDDSTAARRLQGAWRARRRRRLVEDFSSGLGISIDNIGNMTFDDVTALLAEEKVLATTSSILELFQLQSVDASATPDRTIVRTFLSAYLILGHPTTVFSKNGAQEEDLMEKARDLLVAFESSLWKLAPWNRYTPAPTQVESLSQAHNTFVTAFSAWRGQDSSALVETMVASFVELDGIWQTVKDDNDGGVANDYKEGIRNSQVNLLRKIRKLAGPDRADILIKKAIKESRRIKRRRRPATEVTPRAADSPSSSAPPGLSENADPDITAATQLHASQPAVENGDSESMELTKLFSAVPNNRVLVHELAIDKDYRIEVSPHSDTKDSINRAVCDGMRKGVEQGTGAPWTVAMAQNIRSKLLKLVQEGNSMHRHISEVIDLDMISMQCAHGAFSYNDFFASMANILPKLCAPFRDEQVRVLAEDLRKGSDEVGNMIDLLFRLLHVIDLLSLDYSNYLLMNVAPTLLREASAYEQRQFAQDLEKGVITLQKTKHWWRNASVNVLTEAERRDPESVNRPADRPTSERIYARGLVDLAVATTPLQETDLPETLHLDKSRIVRIRGDALRITTIGAILLTAKNLLKREMRSQWKTEAARIWDILLKDGYDSTAESTVSMSDRILSVITQAMPPTTRAQLANTITRFLAQVETGRLADPVMKVLFQRLKSHIFLRVSASSSGERVRAASNASESLATSGLSEFIVQVGGIVDTLGRISEVDRKAHGTWYEHVAREVDGREGEGLPALVS